MNHIYKVIWNTITQTWGAVSELSRAKGKTKSSKTLSAVVLAAVSIGVTIDNAEAAINYPQGTHTVNGMAIGTNSYANRNSVAYGEAAKANDGYSVAIGANAVTNRVGSGEIGVSPDRGMIAIGSNSVAKLEGATAIGSKAEAAGQQSTAVGNGAQAKGYNSSAFGEGAIAEKNYGVAVGKSANAKEQLGIAVGKNASAENYLSTAVGAKTQAKGESSIAIGSGDLNGGTDLDAPEGAKATGNASMAVGASAKATADNATALGKKATASGRDSIAAGATANASGTDSIATGHNANATGANAVATGANASAAKNAAAYGDNAKATAGWSSAFGNQSKATATDSSAFGNSANVSAQNGTAIGSHSTVTAINGTALGNQAEVTSAGGVALGQGSKTTNKDGSARQGLNKNSYQIVRVSNDQNSKDYNKFQDGGFSYSDKDTPDKVYAPVKLVDAPGALEAIKNTIRGSTGPVSIGNKDTTRQLINVAPGSADSDAVNVAQLKAVAGAIKHYDVVSPNGDITVTHPDPHDPNKTVWNLDLNPARVKEITKWKLRDVEENGNLKAGKTDALVKGDETVTFQDTDTIDVERVGTDGKTLKFHTKKNIKYFSVNSSGGGNENNNGATATDAIAIGKDASSTGSNAVSLGFGAKALGSNNTAIGPGAQAKDVRTTAIGYNAKAEAASAVSIGYEANATKSRSLAIGQDATASANNAIALGSSGQQSGNDRPNKTTASAEHAVAIGSGAVANIANGIALGSQSKTTADKGQTGFDASQDVEGARTNKYNNLKNNIQNVRTSTLAGLSIGDTGKTRQINHLAAGTADDDAVNVAQLKSVNLAFKGDNNTKGDVRLHDQRLSVVGAENSFITTKASSGKLEINTTKSNELQFTTGAANNITTPTGLTTDKAVANAINNSGWTLQANDKTVGLINPGDKVNIKAGTGVTIKPTNEANGVSTLTISAAQQNYSWKLKEDSQPADQALAVTNNTAVSLKGENFLNITNKGGGNFVFKTVTADVGMNAVTGATNQATATGLTTNKAVADAIANSGFQLKENGTLKNVVNPGESLNFKPGQGTSVSVDTNGDVQVNANVADIKAGNNVTVAKGNNGVYTINALDTNTQASVSKLNNDSPITIDSNATNSAGAKDYKLDVNVDGTTITKTGGVLKAVIPAVEKVDLTVNKTGDKAGTVGTPVEADKGKFVTAENVVKAVNESFWVAKKGNRVETNEDTTSADTNVTAGSNVTFVAGKNIALQKDGNKFIYATKDNVTFTDVTTNNFTVNANGNVNMNGNQIHNVGGGTQDTDAVNYKQLKDSISTETVRKADATAGDKNIVEVDPTAETGKGTKGATYNIAVKESAVKNIAKTAVKVVDGKNTTAVNKGEENNTQKYAVDVKGDLTEITSITNTTGNGKVEFTGDGVVNITDGNATGNHPIKLDGKTGDITGLTNTTLGGESFAKSGRAATEEQLDIVNKKFDNKVSLGGNSGETTKKALSTDGGIKFNVKAADDNKVVTTEAAGDDVNIKFSGEEAAKVTNLSYKANKGTAKKVTLENGLDFTNGTHTTAEVDDNGVVKFNVKTAKVDVPTTQPATLTGKFDAPETDGVATIKNVVDVVNNSGWKISQGDNQKGIVKAGDEVSFANGDGTTVSVETDTTNPNKRIVKVNATLKEAAKGTIVAVTENGTGDNAPKKGQVKANSGDENKVTTVENVANMINSAKWFAKADNSEDDLAETKNDNGEAVNAGSELTFKAGKNLHVNRTNGVFTFALDSALKDLTSTTYKNGDKTVTVSADTNGDLHISKPKPGSTTNETVDAKITGVAEGTQDTDAVNYKQLKDSISTETVRKADATAGDKNIVEVDPTAETGKGTKGATYNIAVKESAVKNIAKTAVKVVDGKNTTAVNKGEENNTQKYAVDVKGDLTEITSITNTTGNGKVEFTGDGVVNITDGNATGNHPIKLDGKTGDITGLTNTTLGGESFAKSGRAATEEQLDIVNKKFDNKVSLGGNSGETTKKALSTDGGIKFNVKAADDNKVVTTEAAGDDVNIKFSGEEAAKVTNLSYKANKGTAKKVTLENGLDFTNGTHTTAEVDDNGVVKFNVKTAKVDVPTTQPATLTGKFDAPETDGVATIKNVVDVVNNSGWKISQGDNQKGIVKAGDEVSFANGDGTTVSVETDTTNPNKRIVKVNATLKEAAKGTIVAVTENGTGDNAPKKGQVKANSGDENKVTTVENVANMINSAKWFAKADNSEDDLAETKNDNGEAVNAGSELTFKAGKNLHVNRTNGVFTFALDSALKDLTSTTYKNGDKTVTVSADTNGDLHISKPKPGSTTNETVDAKITGVAEGTQDNDAVNVKQLKSTELHIAPTKANGKASDVTYTYDDETKSVTLKYKDGNGNVVANTEAKIDLSGLASKIKDYSFKTNATGSNLVETGTETTVASGKSVNFAASDNLTLKQEVDKGNVTYTYGLKNQVVVGEKGTPGADGKPGVDGSIGVNGKDGSAVAINGKDGSIGLNGENGKNGLTIKGAQGPSGVDGKDGKDGKESTTMTRIVYETPKDAGSTETIKHEVATLDDGQKYAGDNYVAAKDNQAESNVIAKKANERLDIVGGAKGNLTEGNIGVNAKDGKLHVQLAEKVNLGDKGSVTIGDTVVNNNGITINSPADLNGVTNKTVSLTNQGLNNGGNKITNVAEGENDTDAVNVKQLKDFKTKVADGGLTFAGNSGPAHKAKLNTTVNIKGGKDNTDATQFDNGKNVMTTVNDNTVTVSIKKTPEVEGINITDTTGNVKVKLTQTDEGLKVSDGDNNETRITNVKAGEKETDAVNVKQLNSAKTEVTAGDNINVTLSTGANGQTIYKVSAKGINDTSAAVKGGSDHIKVTKAANTHKDGSTTVTDYTVDLSDKTKGDIDKGVKAHNKVTNEGLTFNADNGTTTGVKKLGSEVSVNGDGKNITTTADENGVKVSMKDDIKVNSVTAKEVKVGDVNINENGINAGGKRITNVAPGKDGTDAVNVNQLKYVAGNISNQINNVDKGLRAGIAGALASGGLYHVTTAGKSMVSVGAGTYRGQNALAVGYSRLSDNGKVGVKFTVNSNSQGHAGASASVGYQW